MLRFTLRQLGYFAAVARHGSIAEAARSLNVSQSAIAAAIDKLEDAIGLRLFERVHARGVTLTPQGTEALARARSLMQAAEQTAQDFRAIAADVIGHLRFGCYHTLAPFYAPGIVAAMRARHPGVAVELVEGRQDALVPGLEARAIDVALLFTLDQRHALEWEEVKTLPPYVLLPPEHPLAAQDAVSLAALADEPFVMLDWPVAREYFKAVLRAVDIDPPVAFRTQSFEVVRDAVASGLGFSLLSTRPRTDVTYSGAIVACRTIRERVPPAVVALAWPAGAPASPLREKFLDVCHEYFARENAV